MCTINKIFGMMKDRGLTQKELAEHLGLKKSAISAWGSGVNSSWRKYLPQIAEFLGVSIDSLVNDEGFPAANLSLLPKTKKVPLLGEIACGEPILAIENVVDFVNVPFDINADMALTCKGDSMINARIFDGDIVYIKQQPEVENGEIAAVLIGEEATLKRVYLKEGHLILSPCNPMYEAMVFVGKEAENVQIIGKAVAFTSIIRV